MHAFSAVSKPPENIAAAKFRPLHEEPPPAGLHSGSRSSTLVNGGQQVFAERQAIAGDNFAAAPAELDCANLLALAARMDGALYLHSGRRSTSSEQEYFRLQEEGAAEIGADNGLQRIEAGGADVVQRRAEHGGVRLLFGEPGKADGSKLALKQAHGRTLLCMAADCGSLVDLQAAKRAASKHWRVTFAAGDGCASAACSAHHWPARFRERQAAMAAALLDGARVLVLWPPTTAPRSTLHAAPLDLARSISSGTLGDTSQRKPKRPRGSQRQEQRHAKRQRRQQ